MASSSFVEQPPRGKEVSLGGDFPNTIGTGKLVMGWCAPNHLSAMLRTAPQEEQNLGVAMPPKAKERVSEIHTTKLAISTQTKRPDLAWKWVMDEALLKAVNHKKSPEEALNELAATFNRELQRGRSNRK